MNVLYFIADGINEYNSSRWRVSTPFNAINQRDWNHKARIASSQRWMKQDDETKKLCQWADIIHIQRVGIDKSIPATKYWRERGKAVVIDYDDDYFRINKGNAAYKFWGEGNVDVNLPDGTKFQQAMDRHPVTQFIEGMQACTAVTMPSRLLAEDARKYGANAFFIPNFLERRLYKTTNTKPYDKNRIIIGWGGSLSHIESFEHSGIVPALKKILNEMENVFLLIVGDKRVIEKLSSLGVRKDKIVYHPYVPFDRWQDTLKLYDIGIAPLALEYDMRRSWIKLAEYLSMGIPFVATDGSPYQETKAHLKEVSGSFVYQGSNGCTPNAAGWEQELRKAIENVEKLKQTAVRNQEYYFNVYNIENNIEWMIEMYQAIINLEKGK